MKPGPESSLLAPDSGYLQQVDYRRLSEAAARGDVIIRFLCYPGDFVLEGSPLASVRSLRHHNLSDQVLDSLQHRFATAVSVERKRSVSYDPEYAIVRITEIAALGMAPSFADPVATLACINALTVGLRELLRAPVRSHVHCDSMGQPRIFENKTPCERILSSAFDPMRPIVKNSVGLTVYLLQAISALVPFLSTPAQFLELKGSSRVDSRWGLPWLVFARPFRYRRCISICPPLFVMPGAGGGDYRRVLLAAAGCIRDSFLTA